uniref:Metallo-beta-lactamase domain-containing protein 1 n=1 Tax=Ditylenchus dipsaci TaxID=166011 RepID=A0A915EJY6_9BILA
MLQITLFLLFSVCSSVHARSSWRPFNSLPSPCECFRKCGPHMFMPYSPIPALPPPHHWSVEAQRSLGLPVSSGTFLPFLGHAPSPYQDLQFPLVLPLIHGNFSNNDNKLAMHPSVVLVIDRNASTNEKKFILVDTGLSLFKHNLVAALHSHRVDPSMIDTVVITHSDTDTMGNLNLFPCAEVLSSNRIAKENFFIQQKMPTFDGNRSDLPFHKLFENTELYLTPGFGLQDHSLIVRNVENHGTVAIVGKLVLNETDLASSNMAIREFATDDVEQRKLWQATRREVVCLADYIIPGHGAPFKVSDELKSLAECHTKGTETTVTTTAPSLTQKIKKWKIHKNKPQN